MIIGIMIAVKKIGGSDVNQVIRKVTWKSGTTYDMYRHDISRTNTSKPSGATSLYSANYYVVNEDFKVYICLIMEQIQKIQLVNHL